MVGDGKISAAQNSMKRRFAATEDRPAVIFYGTPLPNEEDDDENKFKMEWNQFATDEEGRRRFHGAFTGGFSAGYYNTVGSEEGETFAYVA